MSKFYTLTFIDKFQRLFTMAGVNYPLMRKMLEMKLLMDRRRVPTVFSGNDNKKNQDNDSNQFLKSLWIYGFIGLVFIPFLFIQDSYIFPMSLIFAILMFILMTSMISDFSQVLLDIRDKNILNTKPVDKRTINTAKIIHVSIYMFFLTATITGIPLVISLFARGFMFFFVFLGQIILIDMLIVVVTALLYILILRFFDGEKLKDIINYVQIMLSISIIVGYQLVIRSFEFIDITFAFSPEWWQIFVPPIWYGAVFELILNGETNAHYMTFTALALFLPFLSLYIYVKSIPSFEGNLEKLSSSEKSKEKIAGSLKKAIVKMICRDKEERAFFNFSMIMMKNERDFKLKVYPSIGLSLVFPFLIIFQSFNEFSLDEIAGNRSFLSIYVAALMVPTVILMLRYSENYQGAWIYDVLPIQRKRAIFRGTLKALLVKLFLPVYLLISTVFLILFTPSILLDLVIAGLGTCVYAVICYKAINGNELPFAESFKLAQQTDGWKIFLLFFPIGGFVGIHFWMTTIEYGVHGYGVLLLIVNWVLWRKVL